MKPKLVRVKNQTLTRLSNGWNRQIKARKILGQVATGNMISVDGVSIDQIENGMVVSGFDAWDSLGFREQIGLIKKLDTHQWLLATCD